MHTTTAFIFARCDSYAQCAGAAQLLLLYAAADAAAAAAAHHFATYAAEFRRKEEVVAKGYQVELASSLLPFGFLLRCISHNAVRRGAATFRLAQVVAHCGGLLERVGDIPRSSSSF